MQFNMPPLRFALSICFAFLLGIFSAQLYHRKMVGPIPNGVWVSIWTGSVSSIQLNITNSELETNSVTGWFREDRMQPFLGKSGVYGKTIISRATIDCTTGMVAIHEQRLYNGAMDIILEEKFNELPREPVELSMMISRLMICGESVKKPSDKSEQRQKYVNV